MNTFNKFRLSCYADHIKIHAKPSAIGEMSRKNLKKLIMKK